MRAGSNQILMVDHPNPSVHGCPLVVADEAKVKEAGANWTPLFLVRGYNCQYCTVPCARIQLPILHSNLVAIKAVAIAIGG